MKIIFKNIFMVLLFSFILSSCADSGGSSSGVNHPETEPDMPENPINLTINTEVNGLSVNFNAVVSEDVTIEKYEWDFGDGSKDLNGPATSHTYSSANNYTVSLTITYDNGKKAYTVINVKVSDGTQPEIPDTPDNHIGLNIVIDKVETLSDGVNYTFFAGNNKEYTINSYEWNFGDGSPFSNDAKPVHKYTAEKEYTITLKVTYNGGETATTTKKLKRHTITKTELVDKNTNDIALDFDISSYIIDRTGYYYTFTSKHDNKHTINSYKWDFGNGLLGLEDDDQKTKPHPKRKFFSPNTYGVTLTVIYDGGKSASITKKVVIDDKDNITPKEPTTKLYIESKITGRNVLFTVICDNYYQPVSYKWDFGDGTSSTEASPTHTYADTTKTYTVRVMVHYKNHILETVSKDITIKASLKPEIEQSLLKAIMSDSFAAAVSTDGKIYTWGSGSGNGRLGLGEKVRFTTKPTLIKNIGNTSKFIDITTSAYQGHSLYALTEDGKVYSWGSNKYGQLCNGNKNNQFTPQLINFPANTKIKKVKAYKDNVFFLTEDNKLFACGMNSNSQLGIQNQQDVINPTQVNINNKEIKDVYTDKFSSYSFIITMDGEVYSFGKDIFKAGALGLGDVQENKNITKLNITGNVSKMIVDGNAVMALTDEGDVYGWGKGQLGIDKQQSNVPIKLNIGEKIEIFYFKTYKYGSSNGYGFAVAKNTGNIYGWGDNAKNQLCINSVAQVNTPVKIDTIKDKVQYINVSEQFTYVLTNEGKVYGCGDNSHSQLGIADMDVVTTPTIIPFMNNEPISKVYSGYYDSHSNRIYGFAVSKSGSVYSWGKHINGMLGKGKEVQHIKTPEIILSSSNYGKINHLINNDDDSVVFAWTTNKLYGWGWNNDNLIDDKAGRNQFLTPKEIILESK